MGVMTCAWCGEPIPDGARGWLRAVQTGGGPLVQTAYHEQCYADGIAYARSVETRWSGARNLL